jgi:hypothetical protein
VRSFGFVGLTGGAGLRLDLEMGHVFASERAREQARRITAYVAVAGPAALVARSGEIVVSSGSDAEPLAEFAESFVGKAAGVFARPAEGVLHDEMVFCVAVGSRYVLAVIDERCIVPSEIEARLLRAARLFERMLGATDVGPSGSTGSGAPAEVGVASFWLH